MKHHFTSASMNITSVDGFVTNVTINLEITPHVTHLNTAAVKSDPGGAGYEDLMTQALASIKSHPSSTDCKQRQSWDYVALPLTCGGAQARLYKQSQKLEQTAAKKRKAKIKIQLRERKFIFPPCVNRLNLRINKTKCSIYTLKLVRLLWWFIYSLRFAWSEARKQDTKNDV